MPDLEVLRRIAARSAISETEAFEAHGGSDYEDDPVLESTGHFEISVPSDAEVRALISEDARLAVINFEVTSEAAYQRKYERPIAPAGDSGITIGVGYDLGYNEKDGVRRDLAGLIPDADIETLALACGLRGENARRRLAEFRNVRVPWEAALQLFERATMPRFGRLTLQAFPNSAQLSGHAFGALFSLVYNRGTSMSGDRRVEMRAIRDLCSAQKWQSVPAEFRKMKRWWEGKPGLAGVVKRREAEAILFGRGLELMQVAAARPASPASLESVRSDAYLEGDGYAYEELPEGQFESANPEWDRVQWPRDDTKAPDYRHITDRSLSGKTFEFGPDEIELLIQSNAFEPSRQYGRIPFALRGAELVSSLSNPSVETKQENRTALTLRDARPDHRSFRCVIGVYDCDRRRMSGFASSTVPNPKAVATHVARPPQANMMLTGCYPFVVGWHQWSKAEKRIPGCLVEDGFQKAVLRSKDYVLEITDEVDNRSPCGDNNHPGKSEGPFPFSSWGCLVVKGSVDPVRGGNREQVAHTGEWALYRKALGLPDRGTGGHGNKFDFVLLTGLEGAIAHSLVKDARAGAPSSGDPGPLMRLRQGSRGPRVTRLQERLGLAQTGVFDHATAKALATKQKTLGWSDGTYAPALDSAFGFDVFAPMQFAALESLESAVDKQDELEGLFYELGLENEAIRRGGFESVGGASLEATQLEFGPAVLKTIGRSIAKEIELQVHGYICGPETINRIVDRDAIRAQVDQAAKLGVGVLKQCLVSIIATTTTWFVSRATVEKLVDIVLERIVQPAVGQAGVGAINKIDGGVTWVCQQWQKNIEERYSVIVAQASDPILVVPDPVAPPVADINAAGPQIDTLLGLIEQSAFGAKVDPVGVRNYLNSLRKIIDDPGQQITDEQASRLIKALCDSAFMEQVQGTTGHDPYLMVSDLEQVLQASNPDLSQARTLTKDLHGLLADARIALLPDAVVRVLTALKNKRLFDEMSWLADRFLTRNPSLIGVVGPLYAQGLIDGGRISAGIAVLKSAAERPDLTIEQLAEVKGLLGRAHKQVYANHVRSASEAIALKQSFEPHLVSAIEHYSSIYDPAKPDDKYWHGINAVALLKCAERDRITIADAPDAGQIAGGMIAALEPNAQTAEDPFALASIGEAYLARGDEANAAKYYGLFARHPKVNAFSLGSAARQLEEIWRVKAGTEGAGAILTGLKSALAVTEGGTLQLSPEERRTISAAETVAFAEEFERATKDGQYINFATLKVIVERGASVAAVQRPLGNVGETLGTGFLVSHTQFSGLDPSKSYVLTNAHVVTDDSQPGADPASAIRRDQARIVFENEEIDGKRDVYLAKRVIWQSPSNALDATLIELDRKVEGALPLLFAPPQFVLEPETNTRKGTRLAVLGHPKGGRLSLSLQGSISEMRAVLVDKGCRNGLKDPEFLHYSTPTEGGNSGSPVFEVDNWKVVGLHHAGYPDNGWPALGGRSGTNKANEGIWIESIRRAVNAHNEGAPAPKRKWFRS